jgi:hypothetical protein
MCARRGVTHAADQNFWLLYLPAVPAISAATAASTTATAATTATAESTTAAATCGLRTRFIHVQRPAVHFRTIQLGDRVLRVPLFRHFDESKAARLTRVSIRHNIYTLDVPVLGKRCVQFVLRGLIAEIPDKDIRHALTP